MEVISFVTGDWAFCTIFGERILGQVQEVRPGTVWLNYKFNLKYGPGGWWRKEAIQKISQEEATLRLLRGH